MKIQNFALFILFLIHFTLFSQKNLTKGYIVANGGDTIRGEIDNKNWNKNPDDIQFLKDGSSEIVKYKPFEIISFAVANDIYFSKIVSVDVSSIDIDQMTQSPDPVMKTDTVFLSAYVLGKANLYYFNEDGKEHFFIEKDTAIHELIHNKYRKFVNSVLFLVESDSYKHQLLVNMGDCQNIISTIQDIEFNSSSFIKLFEKYNSCDKATSTFVKKYEKVKCEPIIFLGGSLTKLTFKSDIDNYIQNADFNPSINFTGGIALNIVFPRSHQSWSLYNDLLYKYYKTTGTYENNKGPNNVVATTYLFNFEYIKLTTLIRYQYPGKIAKPYINVGITNGYAIRYENVKTIQENFYGSYREYSENALGDIRKYEQGMVVGVGLVYKRFNAELRYERANGMLRTIYTGAETRSCYFLIGYRFYNFF